MHVLDSRWTRQLRLLVLDEAAARILVTRGAMVTVALEPLNIGDNVTLILMSFFNSARCLAIMPRISGKGRILVLRYT